MMIPTPRNSTDKAILVKLPCPYDAADINRTCTGLVSTDDDDERQFLLFVWNLLPLEVLKRQANAGIISLSPFIFVTTSLSSSSLKLIQQFSNQQDVIIIIILVQHQQQAEKISAVRFDKRGANETTRDESHGTSSTSWLLPCIYNKEI